MILDRIRLLTILDTLKIASGTKVMEVSYYVKFTIDKAGSAVYLSTTDFQTFMVISYGDIDMIVLDDVPEIFLIKFQQLLSLLKSSTTPDVELCSDNKDGHIKITTNGSFSFPLFKEASQFPSANFENTVAGIWNAGQLKDIWDKISIAISKDVTKLSYQGVHFDGNWATSDNRRFALVRGDAAHTYDGKSVLIPSAIGAVFARCSGDVKIGVNMDGNMLVVANDDTGMLAAIRLIESQFVPYQKLLDSRQQNVTVTIPKIELLGVLSRLSCFTDKLYKVGRFMITATSEGAQMQCDIEHDTGEGTEIIEATDFDFSGVKSVDQMTNTIAFSYHIENLADGVSAVDSQTEVVLNIQPDGKLWIDEDSFSYLLSPITT